MLRRLESTRQLLFGGAASRSLLFRCRGILAFVVRFPDIAYDIGDRPALRGRQLPKNTVRWSPQGDLKPVLPRQKPSDERSEAFVLICG